MLTPRNSGIPGHGAVVQRARRSANGSGTSARRSTWAAQRRGRRPAGGLELGREAERGAAARRDPPGEDARLDRVHQGGRAERPRLEAEGRTRLGELALERERVGRDGNGRSGRPDAVAHARAERREPDGVGERRVHALAGACARLVHGHGRQLGEPAGIDVDPAAARLVAEVGGDDDGQAEVAAREGERQVAGEVAGVGDEEDGVGGGLQEELVERSVAGRLVVEGSRPRQVDEPGPAPAGGHELALERDGRAGRVGGLDEAVAGAREEGRLADVRATDEGDDRDRRGTRRGDVGSGVAGGRRHGRGSGPRRRRAAGSRSGRPRPPTGRSAIGRGPRRRARRAACGS